MAGEAGLTVFYSWQSDLKASTNRSFIEDALEKALRAVARDGAVDKPERPEAPRLDQATAGVPGAPDIAATILAKIDQAAAIVADVSIVNATTDPPSWLQHLPRLRPQREQRATPNPNVLVELGYALKALGPDRLILVMNTAYGPVEQLPFDLRPRRVLTYHLEPGSNDKSEARAKLVRDLSGALRVILATAATRPQPAPDLPWADHLDKGLPPPRYRQDPPTMLDLDGLGAPDDAVRLFEHQVPGGASDHPGLLQPIIFLRTKGGYVHMPAEAIPTFEPCYAGAVSAHQLMGGTFFADLIVRWQDREGFRWLAVLHSDLERYQLARWELPEGDGALRIGLDLYLTDQRIWRITPTHRVRCRPLTVQPTPRFLGDSFLPQEEVVEELWIPPGAWAADYSDVLTPARLAAAGIAESTAGPLVLTRIWRWDQWGTFTAAETSMAQVDTLPADEPWP